MEQSDCGVKAKQTGWERETHVLKIILTVYATTVDLQLNKEVTKYLQVLGLLEKDVRVIDILIHKP